MGKNHHNYILSIRCLTYNHAPYIEKCLDGFCMQETTFPFVCTIFDDASTDGEPEVIMKYLQKHFDLEDSSVVKNEETDDYLMTYAQHKTNRNCFFAVYFLKYNHFSINKSKLIYISDFIEGNKYYAYCEGDDYWIDPLKLQTQFDYMEKQPDCTMTCTRAKRFSESKGKYIGEQFCRKSDGNLKTIDVINRTGLYIASCSIMFRPWIRENYPDYCQNCKVGDYPLQITAALKGSIYYFDKCTCVYRVSNRASWMGQQKHETVDPARLKVVYGQTKMFEGFAKDYPKYDKVFQNKISEHILRNMPKRSECSNADLWKYQELFSKEFSNMSLKWKFFYIICKLRIPYIKKFYYKTLFSDYMPPILHYDNVIKRMITKIF